MNILLVGGSCSLMDSMILKFLMSECVANGVSCYYTHARKVDHADLERLDALFNKSVDVEE